MTRATTVTLAGLAAILVAAVLLAAILVAAGCGSSSPSGTASQAPSVAPSATTSQGPAATGSPTPVPPTVPPSPPAGTVLVDIPEGGILLPVPTGWVQIPAEDLADPAVRAQIGAQYPGADALLDQTERLNGQAAPVFLAVDPSAVDRGEPLAANLSVMATQPSVGGPLLDIAVGFIADGMAETLEATAPPVRERVPTQVGDAVRIRMEVPPRDGHEIVAIAWVIGAPRATLLITLLGPKAAVDMLDLDTFAATLVRNAGGTQ